LDFATDPIPADQNAAILYKQALDNPVLKDLDSVIEREFGDLIATLDDDSWPLVYEFTINREFRQKHPDELQKLLGMFKDTFVLCRKARLRDKVDWQGDFSGKAYDYVGLPGVVCCIKIANLMSLAVVEAHDAGRDGDAVEYIHDMIVLGDSLTKYPLLIDHMAGHSVSDKGVNALEEALPSLKIGDAAGSASITSIRSLLARLLDDAPLGQGLTLALMGQRSLQYDWWMSVLNQEIPPEDVASEFRGSAEDYYISNPVIRACYDYTLAPMFRIRASWSLRSIDTYVLASRSPTLPQYCNAVMQMDRNSEEYFEYDSFLGQLCAKMAGPGNPRAVMHYRRLARRRMVALALAIRLYEIDHGNRPVTLRQLIPGYLGKIPKDPMDGSGGEIRYANEDRAPRLYCKSVSGQGYRQAYADYSGYYVESSEEIGFYINGRPKRPKDKSDQNTSDDDDSN